MNELKPLTSYGICEMGDFMPHVTGFFEFFKEFDFGNYVIIPYLGHPVAKRDYVKHFELSE